MIPHQHILAWENNAPWGEQQKIEQDLIISRALVDIFSDEFLRKELRFRGGTALNKLYFPKPFRYSEDIDVVRTSKGPLGPILGQLRLVLQPWLGKAKYVRSQIAPKLLFTVAEEADGLPLRLKVEINTREIIAFDGELELPFQVENSWFSGSTSIPTYTLEEMLATKFQALLQRDKGRDLYDVAHCLNTFKGLNQDKLIDLFQKYLAIRDLHITRAQAQQRMFAKMEAPQFLADIQSLLPSTEAKSLTESSIKSAIQLVLSALVDKLPGDPWVHTDAKKRQFDIDW